MRHWWRWGDPAYRFQLGPEALEFIFTRLQLEPRAAASEIPPPTLPPASRVTAVLPAVTDPETRLRHAAGRSYPDLVRLRSGRLAHAPDAVIFPQNIDEIAAALQRADCAIVPFGGGTSVVGGVAPLGGRYSGVATMNLTTLDRVLDIDRESRLARVQCGMYGPALESALAREGFTLGHFPQSFEYSTVGGWIATRSAGQASMRYGRIEDMVAALRVVTPVGEIVTRAAPASASGPDVRELLIGSEGTLGVIVEATLRIHPLPEERAFRSYLFRSFESGVAAVRALAQSDRPPAIVRLSDVPETEMVMKLAGANRGLGARMLRMLGRDGGAHLLLGFEASPRSLTGEVEDARESASAHDGFSIGSGPGERWNKDRFRLPYLRDTLLDYSLCVETIETATTWSNLLRLYHAAGAALLSLPGIVLCHLSHAYRDGASLYFTIVTDAPPGEEEKRWTALKTRATDAILDHGGTLSHHHGVGTDHLPWMEREKGAVAMQAMRALKHTLDPRDILNPGKLL
jgi:alkyldihydroxyacetonephosphate synthase